MGLSDVTRVLVLSYSQSGQSTRAAASLAGGLAPQEFTVALEEIRPEPAYSFPWSFWSFLDVFPECVLERPTAIRPPSFGPEERFDLVILVYQVWFLAPSLPIQAFFRSEHSRVLDGTPVVALCVCRNMWHRASDVLKRLVAAAGGVLLDHVVVVDRSPAWASFVTTPRWMLTGRRDAFWIFPPAGVTDEEIRSLSRFGETISRGWRASGGRPTAPLLRGTDAVAVDRRTIVPELIGRITFPPWARLVAAAGRPGSLPRRLALLFFVAFLLFAIIVLIPASLLAALLILPFVRGRLRRYSERLRHPSGLDPEEPSAEAPLEAGRRATAP